MSESIRIFGEFLFGLCCLALALSCEALAHAMRRSSYVLMELADGLWEQAFRLGTWD